MDVLSQTTSSELLVAGSNRSEAHWKSRRAAGDTRFGGPIWWNTPLKDDDEDADEDEFRTQWEQEGAPAAAAAPGPSKRQRDAAEEEAELPDEVQALSLIHI